MQQEELLKEIKEELKEIKEQLKAITIRKHIEVHVSGPKREP
jgi:hypothetical protein